MDEIVIGLLMVVSLGIGFAIGIGIGLGSITDANTRAVLTELRPCETPGEHIKVFDLNFVCDGAKNWREIEDWTPGAEDADR